MKKLIFTSSLLLAASLQAQTLVDRPDNSRTVIGGWDFNGFTAGNTGSLTLNARYNQQYTPYHTAGTGGQGDADYQATLYFTTNGATFSGARPISTANAPVYDLAADGLGSNNSLGDTSTNARSIALSAVTPAHVLDNARAVFRVQTLTTFDLFEGISVAYSARNQGSVNATISWSYSINGGASFIAIDGSADIIAPSASFAVYDADFSSVLALEGVKDLLIGMEYTESGANASVLLDNVAIYSATSSLAPIPEPASFAAIAGLMGLGLAASRRRRAA